MNESESYKVIRNHIQRAKDEIAYLTKFVEEFENNTPKDANWGWVGDWNALATDIDNVASHAERRARNSRKVVVK